MFLFLVNDVSFAVSTPSTQTDAATLAPPDKIADPTFKEEFATLKSLLSFDGMKHYVDGQIVKEKKIFDDRWEELRTTTIEDIYDTFWIKGRLSGKVSGLKSVVFVKLAGLFASTDQPAMIDLTGRMEASREFGGIPVIYIDSTLCDTPDKCIQKHAIDTLLQWEDFRLNVLGIASTEKMCNWIRHHADYPYKNLNRTQYRGMTSRDIAELFNRYSYPLSGIYAELNQNKGAASSTIEHTQSMFMYGFDINAPHKSNPPNEADPESHKAKPATASSQSDGQRRINKIISKIKRLDLALEKAELERRLASRSQLAMLNHITTQIGALAAGLDDTADVDAEGRIPALNGFLGLVHRDPYLNAHNILWANGKVGWLPPLRQDEPESPIDRCGIQNKQDSILAKELTANPINIVVRIQEMFDNLLARFSGEKGIDENGLARAMADFFKPIFNLSDFPSPIEYLSELGTLYRVYIASLLLPQSIKDNALNHFKQAVKYITRGFSPSAKEGDEFFASFYATHRFIDTNDLGLGATERITLKEMLRRYASKYPAKLSDPETVLALARESGGAVILKYDFSNNDETETVPLVGPNERFWIIFEYPRFSAPEGGAPSAENIAVGLGELTTIEQDEMEKDFSELGNRIATISNKNKKFDYYAKDKEKDACVKEWIDAQNLASLDLAKKTFLYFHNKFNGNRHDSAYSLSSISYAAYHILAYLMDDTTVADWARQLVTTVYRNGHHIYSDASGNKFLSEDFELMLSLLIKNHCEAILPIATHVLFEVEYDVKTRSIHILRSMITGHGYGDLIKASLVLSLTYPYYTFQPAKAVLAASGSAKDFLLHDIMRYCMYTNSPGTSHADYPEYTPGDLVIWLFTSSLEYPIIEFYRVLGEETNARLARQIFRFLLNDRLQFPNFDEEASRQQFVDLFIVLHTRHKISMRDCEFNSILEVLRDERDYRREEITKLLISLLDDPSRDDIEYILDLLENAYEEPAGQDAVVRHYTDPASPYFDRALAYMITMKSPEYFARVWDAVDDADNVGKLTAEKVAAIGRYSVAMLEAAERGRIIVLGDTERSRIMAFANKHIFATTLAQSKETAKVWISLAGLLGRTDLYDQIASSLETGEAHTEHLDAFFRLSSEQSFASLHETLLKMLIGDEREMAALKNFLDRYDQESVRKKKRPFFEKLLDVAVENQQKPQFNQIMTTYAHRDGEGAAVYLESHRNIDVSALDLWRNCSPEDSNDYNEAEKRFVPRSVRKELVISHIRSLSAIDILSSLCLINNDLQAAESIRESLVTIFFSDTGITRNEVKEPTFDSDYGTQPLSKILEILLAWDGNTESDWLLASFLALKPINDLRLCDIDLDNVETPEKRMSVLIEYDPAFYKPLENKIKEYLEWLSREGILTGKSSLLLDRFVAYFISEELGGVAPKMRLDRGQVDTERVEAMQSFLNSSIIPSFYPHGLKKDIKGNFRGAFLRVLAAAWVKDASQRTCNAQPIIFMLPPLKQQSDGGQQGAAGVGSSVSHLTTPPIERTSPKTGVGEDSSDSILAKELTANMVAIENMRYLTEVLPPVTEDKVRYYVMRYNEAKLKNYALKLDMDADAFTKLFEAYVAVLQLKLGGKDRVELKPSGGTTPLISVKCYHSRAKADETLIGKGQIDIYGEEIDTNSTLRVIDMANIAFAISGIPLAPKEGELDAYSRTISFIQAQYRELTGKPISLDEILRDDRLITLQAIRPIPVARLREYYESTIKQLESAA